MSLNNDKSEQKRFFNNIKLYLTSITARRCQYMYLGITDDKNEYILSNLEPDVYLKFCDATFCIHILKIKNDQLVKDIKQLFNMFNVPTNIPYVLNIAAIVTLLNKTKNYDEIAHSIDANRIICVTEDEDKKTVLGFPMLIFQSVQVMYGIYKAYSGIVLSSDDLATEHKDGRIVKNMYNKDVNFVIQDLVESAIDDGIVKAEFNTVHYFSPNTTPYNNLKFTITLVDGAESVSNKQFINKIKEKFYYKLVTWLTDGCIEFCTIYEDANIIVRSTRPHIRIYLNKIKGNEK